jgi:hypothetical protein
MLLTDSQLRAPAAGVGRMGRLGGECVALPMGSGCLRPGSRAWRMCCRGFLPPFAGAGRSRRDARIAPAEQEPRLHVAGLLPWNERARLEAAPLPPEPHNRRSSNASASSTIRLSSPMLRSARSLARARSDAARFAREQQRRRDSWISIVAAASQMSANVELVGADFVREDSLRPCLARIVERRSVPAYPAVAE